MSSKGACLIMAAGYSRRFQGDKRQALLPNGRSLLNQSIQQIHDTGLDYYLVLREQDSIELVLDKPISHILRLGNEDQGFGDNLSAAIKQLSTPYEYLLICLADMPLIQTQTYQTIAATIESSDADAIIPSYQRKNGNPVAIKPFFIEKFKSLSGEQGGKKILQDHPNSIAYLPCNDPSICIDIDDAKDLSDSYQLIAQQPTSCEISPTQA